MLGRRRRRSANIKTTLSQRRVFAVIPVKCIVGSQFQCGTPGYPRTRHNPPALRISACGVIITCQGA